MLTLEQLKSDTKLLLDFLKNMIKNKNIVGFDVVELSPKEGLVAPDFLAAKLIYRILGYIFFTKGAGK